MPVKKVIMGVRPESGEVTVMCSCDALAWACHDQPQFHSIFNMTLKEWHYIQSMNHEKIPEHGAEEKEEGNTCMWSWGVALSRRYTSYC